MDKLVGKIEIPLVRNAIEKAGLHLVTEIDLDRLADIAADLRELRHESEKRIHRSL